MFIRIAYQLINLLPKNFISYVVGVLSRIKLPKPFHLLLTAPSVAAVRINMSEAELPLNSYQTIEDVFTRRLKPGIRPIQAKVCSPCDGYIAQCGPLSAGQAIQAKGLLYGINELIWGEMKVVEAAKELDVHSTFYLAPHNYHRVHSPVGGTLTKIRHIPGTLWPVNKPFVTFLPKIFV
jgi:phosphatidylserine decarboxylase